MDLKLEVKEARTKGGVWVATYGYREAPADIQEAVFLANGLDNIFPAELAFLRANVEGDTFTPYSRTGGEVFYDDREDGKVVALPRGGISRIVGIANIVAAHREGREFVIPNKQREQVYGLVDECLGNGTAVLARYGQNSVATDELGKKELTGKLYSDERLGAKAQDYGEWLKESGKGVHNIFFDDKDYAHQQNGPYVNRVRLYGAVNVFSAGGFSRNLISHYGAFGVSIKKSAEGGTKNILSK